MIEIKSYSTLILLLSLIVFFGCLYMGYIRFVDESLNSATLDILRGIFQVMSRRRKRNSIILFSVLALIPLPLFRSKLKGFLVSVIKVLSSLAFDLFFLVFGAVISVLMGFYALVIVLSLNFVFISSLWLSIGSIIGFIVVIMNPTYKNVLALYIIHVKESLEQKYHLSNVFNDVIIAIPPHYKEALISWMNKLHSVVNKMIPIA